MKREVIEIMNSKNKPVRKILLGKNNNRELAEAEIIFLDKHSNQKND